MPSKHDRYHRRDSEAIVRVLLQKLRTVFISTFNMDDREARIAGATCDLLEEVERVE
jgi:hypothetical protein